MPVRPSITASVRWSTSERISAVDRTATAVSVVSRANQRIDGRKRLARLDRDGDRDHEHPDEGHAGADPADAEARGQRHQRHQQPARRVARDAAGDGDRPGNHQLRDRPRREQRVFGRAHALGDPLRQAETQNGDDQQSEPPPADERHRSTDPDRDQRERDRARSLQPLIHVEQPVARRGVRAQPGGSMNPVHHLGHRPAALDLVPRTVARPCQVRAGADRRRRAR